jgi:cytochrome c biogenesis protein CcmG, thiol:disulfide interchange protein DsbE
MAKFSPLMIAPPVIFAGFVVLAAIGMMREDPNGLPSTFIGKPAPSITDKALGAYPAITTADMADGEISIVNFWASWCPPCRAEHPRLLALEAEGFKVLGVNFKDDEADALSYLEDEENPFRKLAFDAKGRTAIDWGVSAPPETFIVSGDGTVLHRFVGPLVGSAYEQLFAPALEAALAD